MTKHTISFFKSYETFELLVLSENEIKKLLDLQRAIDNFCLGNDCIAKIRA